MRPVRVRGFMRSPRKIRNIDVLPAGVFPCTYRPAENPMSTSRIHRFTRLGLVLLAAALGLTLVSFALGDLWVTLLAIFQTPARTADSLHTLWIPLSGWIVDGAIALLGLFGFALVWRGRWELGGAYASRMGLALLAVLVSAVAYALYALTGVLLGTFSGFAFLIPWHGLLAVAGGASVGLALYWILANLPLAGSRALAAVALALGIAGMVILNLADFGLRRVRVAGLEGAGLGLALASVTLWLVLCLWGHESLRNRRASSPVTASADG